MRKIIVSTMVTLDGVMENPMWSIDYMGDDVMQYAHNQLFSSDALIMGRVTYEGFAESWGPRAGADEFADRINSLPKYVASRTLQAPLIWNANLIEADIAETILALKQESGQNILQYGCGELTHTLLKYGLVDELRFLVFPLSVGNGQRILDSVGETRLNLLEVKSFHKGVVALHYQPQSD